MKNNKKILTSIEPIFDNTVPIFQRIYNSVKETIVNIITPPKAGNEIISLKALEEPLLPWSAKVNTNATSQIYQILSTEYLISAIDGTN